jgi:predicted amidohydrolase
VGNPVSYWLTAQQIGFCCVSDHLAICHLSSAIGDWQLAIGDWPLTIRSEAASPVYANANANAPLRARQDASTLRGHSQVTVPFKRVLQRCDHSREAMLVQSVDTAILADAEIAYAIRQDLKKGLSLDA